MARATPKREKIPAECRWKTRDLYRSDAAWERERAAIAAALPALAEHRGKLKRGGVAAVKVCLDEVFALRQRLARLSSYASRKNDEDTRVPRYQAMREVVEKLGSELEAQAAFVEPELLSLSNRTLRGLVSAPQLADYSRTLAEILRRKPHILGAQEESLLASLSPLRDAGYNAYSAFCGAELVFPEIVDERGKKVRLTQATFSRYRSSHDRKVRKATFDAFFGTFGGYRSTLASLLSAQVNANVVYARARRYDTALKAALDPDDLPVAVYDNMVSALNKHLPVLHRYLNLRRRLLGLRKLAYYDLYPPIIDQVKLRYPYDKASDALLEALAPMGKRYLQPLKKGLAPTSGWIDPFPNKGKRSGAYMDGSAYDVHPFVLGNYLGDYNSLSMLAHEMGHAMHSYFSNKNQPFPKAGYSIFVAEVASTLNEALLANHVIGKARTKKRKLYLLGEQLEGFRQTMFRQSMFAEFERAMYTRAEKGEALTADALSALYLDVARRYYGHDEGVVQVDERYAVEWAYIPHFYYHYYVFQYVTGMTAATALAERIKREGEAARDRYIDNLLCAGCAKPPIEILRSAGVDLTCSEPYDVAISVFERCIDEAEALL
ncbi:MAG: oligoendopeptidase F [Proteobacteria bacterium]|nr:MAG: oligoendopeptidase F [Pseudomonadota bacterium]